MKQQYKEYIKLNKNILLGFAASIIISAIYMVVVNLSVKLMRLYKNAT